MFLRFQKEKIKKSRNSSLYNLDSNVNEELLTHKGQLLGTSNLNEQSYSSDDDEDLDKDVVNQLHFGGGLVRKVNTQENDNNNKEEDIKRSRHDTLQDIIMKSKLQKKLRQEMKSQQENDTLLLDEAFRDLVSTMAVEFRPMKDKYNRRNEHEVDEDEEIDEYDKSFHEMAFEAKLQASDRTKTNEEIALENKKKLEELEEARLLRMKPVKDKSSKSSYISDDAIDGGLSNTTIPQDTDEVDDDDADEGEEDEEDEEEDDEEDDDFEEDDFEAEAFGISHTSSNKVVIDEQHQKDNDEAKSKTTSMTSNTTKAKVSFSIETSKEKEIALEESSIPIIIECPTNITEFETLIESSCHNTNEVILVIDRILQWNSISLPGNQGKENKPKMMIFYEILIKYFINQGNCLGYDNSNMKEEDILVLVS